MNKTIVNIGDRLWVRRIGDFRTDHGKVIDVKDYSVVTLQCGTRQTTINLLDVQFLTEDWSGKQTPILKYEWGKCELVK